MVEKGNPNGMVNGLDFLKKVKTVSVDSLAEKERKRRKEKIEDLESRSKDLHELVVSENFVVDAAESSSHARSFTPVSEMIIGGRSPHYKTGFSSKLILKVSPENSEVPVKTLNFNGYSPVKAGDHISARIPRYEERKVEPGFFGGGVHSRTFYIDRGFNEKEIAIEVAIIGASGKVIRSDKSVEYDGFVKE